MPGGVRSGSIATLAVTGWRDRFSDGGDGRHSLSPLFLNARRKPPSLNETKSMWPSVGDKQGWNAKIVPPEPIYEARKGEKPRVVATLDLDNRRTMEAEITNRAVDFIKRNASAGKPFFAYIPFSLMHIPTLPNLEFAGKTGNGDWADCVAEMDYRTRHRAEVATPLCFRHGVFTQPRPISDMASFLTSYVRSRTRPASRVPI
jgi:hypothetical protein